MTTTLEKLLYFLAPHDCIVCGIEGNVICVLCCNELIDERSCRCHVCGLPSASCQPCGLCSRKTALNGVFVLGSHDKALKELVARLKFDGSRQVAADIAPTLAGLLPYIELPPTVVHLPTADCRVRKRGFDQAALLANAIAAHKHWQHVELLRRVSTTRQVGASRATRLQQAASLFMLRPGFRLPETAILVDDVVTTGASMEAGAKLIRSAGVKYIYGVAIAGPTS